MRPTANRLTYTWLCRISFLLCKHSTPKRIKCLNAVVLFGPREVVARAEATDRSDEVTRERHIEGPVGGRVEVHKLEAQHHELRPQWRWVLANLRVAKQLLKGGGVAHVVILAQRVQERRLAKAPREERDDEAATILQFADVLGLVRVKRTGSIDIMKRLRVGEGERRTQGKGCCRGRHGDCCWRIAARTSRRRFGG